MQLSHHRVAAFEFIYNQYYKGLYFYALRLVEPPVAEDLLADLFTKLWQSGKTFTSLQHIKNWLRLSLHNACLNALRQQQRQQERHRIFTNIQPDDEDFSTAEVEADVYTLILDALEQLPPQQQQILRMAFIEGMDNARIADLLGIALKSVKNQKSIALKALRKSFNKTDLLGLLLVFS